MVLMSIRAALWIRQSSFPPVTSEIFFAAAFMRMLSGGYELHDWKWY